MSNVRIFGLTIQDGGLAQALDDIQGFLRTGGHHLVATANPEILVYARQHPWYHTVLRGAGLIVPDGTGVVLASWLYGHPLMAGRVTGVSLTEQLIVMSSVRGFSVFLVGERNDVLQKATQYFINKYGKINIVGYEEGPIFSPDAKFPLVDSANNDLLQKIHDKKPDILLVGFGHPKQELWLAHYLPNLPVKVAMGVGGTFDYFAGVIDRAPKPVRSLGLEWLWRLLAQPWRWKRIFTAVIIFPFFVAVDNITKLFHVEHR